MAEVNDVVELNDGSVGVVSAEMDAGSSKMYRVWFNDHFRDVSAESITQTLPASTYEVGDEVGVWPYLGEITSINGDQFSIEVKRHRNVPSLGPVSWTGTHLVPRWRVIRDNDGRIEGIN